MILMCSQCYGLMREQVELIVLYLGVLRICRNWLGSFEVQGCLGMQPNFLYEFHFRLIGSTLKYPLGDIVLSLMCDLSIDSNRRWIPGAKNSTGCQFWE